MMTTIQQRDLHGLRALVTGATSGLGRAIAVQLARDGADVTVHGRDATRGVQTVEEIQLQGGSALFVAADLADATSIVRFAKEVGDIDILVNNAGFALWGPTETFEMASLCSRTPAGIEARTAPRTDGQRRALAVARHIKRHMTLRSCNDV
jgi:NAD(P)-dependent dehydrogenase (short-subunit alcohol dehydrogenase family)